MWQEGRSTCVYSNGQQVILIACLDFCTESFFDEQCVMKARIKEMKNREDGQTILLGPSLFKCA